jgi:uroporphyrinogen-III synthase
MPGTSSKRAPAPASSTRERPPLHVLITRPRPRALDLARTLEARGDTVLIEPLLVIERIADAAPDLAGVQAIVLTSANAVPSLDDAARRLPVFAVGEATATAARQAGCETVVSAAGAGADLVRLIVRRCRSDGGALLHLCGQDVRPGLAEGLVAAGYVLRRQAVYRADPLRALGPDTIATLERHEFDAVLLFSPRTAGIFVDLVSRLGLQASLGASAAVCLSAAVAQPCRELVWRGIYTAVRAELPALLEALEAVRRRC